MDEPQGSNSRRRFLHGQHPAFEAVLLAGGLVMFLVLIYEMHTVPINGQFLNPILVALAGAMLLWPLRSQRAARAILFAGGLLILLWALDKLRGILIPFLIVYLLAFLFDPLVTKLREKHNVPRWVSSMVITLLMVGMLVLFILLLVPNLISQLETLTVRLIDAVGRLREWLMTTTVLDDLERNFRIDKEQIIQQLTANVQAQAAELANRIPQAAQQIVGYVGSLLALITTITIIPVMLYYTLKDYPFIKRRLVELFPTVRGRRDYLVRAGSIVGNYLRGQIIISAIAAFNVTVALMIFQVPFALLIGLMAGVLNMIPNLGVIITNIIAVLLVVIFGDPWFLDAVIVFLVLLGQSILEQTVLTPKILSSQVGLHPVLIILSLLIFGYFMGMFGFLIAVPATALLMTVYKTYRDEFTFELSPQGSEMGRRARRQKGRLKSALEPPAESKPLSEPKNGNPE
jgi:predicted PurR-regulated permease PerM